MEPINPVDPNAQTPPQNESGGDAEAAAFDGMISQVFTMLAQQSMRWSQESLSEAQQD